MSDELIEALSRDYGVHPYSKWRGAFWRLSSLVDLGAGPDHQPALDAAEQSLDWLASPARLRRIHKRVVDGRVRRCATQDGLGVYLSCRLGLAGDERVRTLADSLVETQWPDGGWNCDVRPAASHSSFHETWGPLVGLAVYGAADAASRAAEFLLRHRVYQSHRTGAPAQLAMLHLRYPPYWHYDLLVGLTALARSAGLDDSRVADAITFLERKRGPDGTWHVEGRWWKRPGARGSNVEAVDWGARADELLTRRARDVLAAARREGVACA